MAKHDGDDGISRKRPVVEGFKCHETSRRENGLLTVLFHATLPTCHQEAIRLSSLSFDCREPSCGALEDGEEAVLLSDEDYQVDSNFFDNGYSLDTLEDLQSFAKRSGKSNGPGRCFWADEFALRTTSDGLQMTLLIVDDESSRGSGGDRSAKRRKTSEDNRFVHIGNYPNAILLHRSRREHFNALVIDSHPFIRVETLPSHVRALWKLGKTENSDNVSDTKPPAAAAEGGLSTDESKLPVRTGESNQLPSTHSREIATGPKPAACYAPAYFGTAGFFSSSGTGNFYPKIVGSNAERQMEHYQQHFRIVEVNSTFYGMPTTETINKWRNTFDRKFKLVCKSPKGVTHEGHGLDASLLAQFITRMQPLGEVLDCVLIQCPRTLVVDVEQMKRVKSSLGRTYKGRLAFEFRNEASYHDRNVREYIKSCGWALVLHPNSLGRATVGTSSGGRGESDLHCYATEKLSSVAACGSVSDFAYVRLHGHNDEHSGEYSLSELQEAAEQIDSWRRNGVTVYCFVLVNSEPNQAPKKKGAKAWDKWCAMPKNAKQLESLVHALSDEPIPPAPKTPKKTLLNFFGTKK
ncbi:hypothetical protein THAOC_25308 [Thalassiosira oceanica]|uniref:DUF72 domain-containing protein n=1 Tax=Thalassiosira oceanica TaxID=159749 RepID=K0RMN5_THAOC|nr:hypothetical protein THAOC_25308 [Thalassiosira oceanica]|eukprot:EJK55008.1 hypothetical protein THAOC_25308 [Thalassiosira oceanica]